MDLDRYNLAAMLFERVTALPAAERESFLNRETGDDQELAARVRRMVRFAEQGGSTSPLLAGGIANGSSNEIGSDFQPLSLIGAAIGNFTIEALLGEGGFGVVYRASQTMPVRRSVAIKILKSGMDSQRVIARFEAERQALAMMEHPHIARVIDAGHTSPDVGSRPYFVMELVSGDPITTYCDSKRLGWRERLRLFMNVASAVHHAHQRGIIHRDLKPSNILIAEVDGIPTPKVIDFGIAKALHEPLSPGSAMVTNRLELLGTPQYMSPEQADGNLAAIDIRTDVYSLGVILYELLTGSTPLDAKSLTSASYSQMIKLIAEQRFDRPSARLSKIGDAVHVVAQQHSTDVSHLRRAIRGELDWITMKALDAEPDRRYSTAQALSDDIRRFLEHRPVEAAPPSAAYQIRKYVRRHRVGVLAALIVVVGVVAGGMIAGMGILRASESADQARAVNEFMREVLTSVDPEERGADVRLADVLQSASETAGTRFAGHPEIEAQIHSLLGDVFHSLNLLQQSLVEFKKSVEIWKRVAGPDDPRTLETQLRFGSLLANHNVGQELLDMVDDITPRVHRQFGRDSNWGFEVQCLRGLALTRLAQFEDAQRTFEEGVARMRSLPLDPNRKLRMLDGLASVLNQQIDVAYTEQTTALIPQLLEVSTELVELTSTHLPPTAVMSIRAKTFLASAASKSGNYETATSMAYAALEVMSPARFGDCHRERIQIWNVLATSLIGLGRFDEVGVIRLKQIDCLRRSDESQALWLLSLIHDSIPSLDRARLWQEGEALMDEFTQILSRFGAAHGDLHLRATCYKAHFISSQGRLDEADVLFEQLQSQYEQFKDDRENVGHFHLTFGSHLARRGKFEAAEENLLTVKNAMQDLRAGFWVTHPDDVISAFIHLYTAWDKSDKVEEYEVLREEALQRSRARGKSTQTG